MHGAKAWPLIVSDVATRDPADRDCVDSGQCSRQIWSHSVSPSQHSPGCLPDDPSDHGMPELALTLCGRGSEAIVILRSFQLDYARALDPLGPRFVTF